MKKTFLIFAMAIPCFANEIKFSGETSYTQQQNKSLITQIHAEYSVDLYEPSHKMWSLSIKGKISPDYDHFGNEVKLNVFTVLGIDF